MNTHRFARRAVRLAAGCALGLSLVGLLGAAASAQDVAVRGEIVHTLSGPPIRDGVVLVQGGKITAVGPAATVVIPPGVEVLTAAVVTPGLIDAHSVVGLTGYLNQPTDQDELDKTAPMQPELRAVDSYNAREPLVEWLRGFGITTVHTGHAPGALIAGQTLVAKTRGDTVDAAVIVPCAMIAATLGEGAQATEPDKSPGTRSKVVALLREELLAAQEYQRKCKLADETQHPDRDLRLEAMVELLEGQVPLLVTAQRHQDIVSALRVAQEFKLRLVLDGAAEGYQVIDEIKAAGVPVIVHPSMMRAAGELENATMELAARLHAAGIPIALQSGFEDYVPKTRVVLYEAAVAAAHGLGPEAALSAITLDAAKLLGLEARIGSLEAGKDGDLALYDGDPFEYTSHCVGVVIEGQVVSREAR